MFRFITVVALIMCVEKTYDVVQLRSIYLIMSFIFASVGGKKHIKVELTST